MSARDRETAMALARVAAALDGAVLGLGTATIAVASWVKYLAVSGQLRRIVAAPAVAISDIRSFLVEYGEGDEPVLAAVRGHVRAAPQGKLLVPPGSGEHCVIAKHTQMCLFSEWRGIFGWTFDLHALFFKSLKEQITTSFRWVPFVLVDPQNMTGIVHVNLDRAMQPLPLTSVYHKLIPVESTPYTLFQTIVGNGYPVALLDEEKILPIGKEITAIGFCRPHRASVGISSCPEIPFFLSELTKDEMEVELSSRAQTLFWATVVLGTMSVCLLGFATYRSWKKIKERREARQAQEVFRQTTDDVTDDQSSDEEAGEMGDGQLCVICLRKKRRAAFIPCGHLVCCCKCALIVERQFDPLCPMCRQDIRYMIRIYNN
ncbi:E3 ubiquitin-protein ligase SPL2 [Oryza brachyantha]|uniref:E3 ubiquitin-protein ligase SPL2 n=1 Tax=Oryza brachyantha TaxID=4533 RepID=UPI0003EAA73F|nr:E3 ubiquitin-protein ligase SPL2 [Oryza brachyantha]XP_015690254.1 E3 ubiquitin-protein ligase SPL2 [Oryza brachyantha]